MKNSLFDKYWRNWRATNYMEQSPSSSLSQGISHSVCRAWRCIIVSTSTRYWSLSRVG